MNNTDLIGELRDMAEVEGPGTLCHLLNEAADRLEGLDERMDIVMNETFAELGALERSINRNRILNVINIILLVIIGALKFC